MLHTDRTNALNVLFLEDDDITLELGRVALHDIGGLPVKACKNGSDALQVLITWRPDVLLLDVVMPGMDGLTLLQEIRRRKLTEAPVIFMTSRVDYANVKQYMELGAIAVVKKPFDPLTLADELVKIVARKPARQPDGISMFSTVIQTEGNHLFTRLPEN